MNEDLAKISDVQYQHADPDKEIAGSTGDRGAAESGKAMLPST